MGMKIFTFRWKFARSENLHPRRANFQAAGSALERVVRGTYAYFRPFSIKLTITVNTPYSITISVLGLLGLRWYTVSYLDFASLVFAVNRAQPEPEPRVIAI